MAGFGELSRAPEGANQCLMQGDRRSSEVLLVDVDLSQEQSIIQYRKNPLARSFKHFSQFAILLRHFFQNELAHAEQTVERGAELMRDEVQEIVLRAIEDCQPLVGF